MKKLFISILVFLCIAIYGQDRNLIVTSGSQIVVSDNKIVSYLDTRVWARSMISSYLSLNPHYTESYKSEVTNYLLEVFASDYVMPDASSNYYSIYRDSTTASWFYVWKMDGNITTKSNIKSGDVLKWQMGESIYDQDNTPAHTFVGDEDFVLLTSTDGFSGITSFDLSVNNFSGELCYFNFQNNSSFYIYSNSFTGDLSSWDLSGWTSTFIFYAYGNSFTGDLSSWDLSGWTNVNHFRINTNSLTGIPELAYTTLSTYRANINAVTDVTSIDALFLYMDNYFSSNTPVKNLTVLLNGGTNASPTGGASNTNIVNLQSTFTTAGFTFTATIN